MLQNQVKFMFTAPPKTGSCSELVPSVSVPWNHLPILQMIPLSIPVGANNITTHVA